jgi:hypothetical protein
MINLFTENCPKRLNVRSCTTLAYDLAQIKDGLRCSVFQISVI